MYAEKRRGNLRDCESLRGRISFSVRSKTDIKTLISEKRPTGEKRKGLLNFSSPP